MHSTRPQQQPLLAAIKYWKFLYSARLLSDFTKPFPWLILWDVRKGEYITRVAVCNVVLFLRVCRDLSWGIFPGVVFVLWLNAGYDFLLGAQMVEVCCHKIDRKLGSDCRCLHCSKVWENCNWTKGKVGFVKMIWKRQWDGRGWRKMPDYISWYCVQHGI